MFSWNMVCLFFTIRELAASRSRDDAYDLTKKKKHARSNSPPLKCFGSNGDTPCSTKLTSHWSAQWCAEAERDIVMTISDSANRVNQYCSVTWINQAHMAYGRLIYLSNNWWPHQDCAARDVTAMTKALAMIILDSVLTVKLRSRVSP